MVEPVTSLSVFAIIFAFVILALFIWKLQVNVITEARYLRNREKKAMASLSKVVLPFKVEVQQAKEEEGNSLSLQLTGSKSGFITYYCCVGIEELKKALASDCSDIAHNRSSTDTLNLISLWSSESLKFIFDDSNNETHLRHKCLYGILPKDVLIKLTEVLNDPSRNKMLVPFVVYMQLPEEEIQEVISNTDVVALITVFSIINTRKKYEISAQYIETAANRIFPIKELFNSGVNDSITSSNDGATSSPIESNELCVICHHYPVTRALLPCRHSCVCKICFKKLEVCPICRQLVQSFFCVRDESDIPMSDEEEQDQLSNDINQMGIWDFIKSVWNAS